MPPPNIYDIEWYALATTGKLREKFNELRALVDKLNSEKDEALREVGRLNVALRLRDIGYRGNIANLQPAPIPQVTPAPIVPVKVEPEQKTIDLDDSVQRFSLLELD